MVYTTHCRSVSIRMREAQVVGLGLSHPVLDAGGDHRGVEKLIATTCYDEMNLVLVRNGDWNLDVIFGSVFQDAVME